MQANQRAFLHSLAEDYGFDSESQDPEPHRHICIFKTPRFVSAPMKTLAQCVKIKPPTTAEPAPLGQNHNIMVKDQAADCMIF
jgi:transcriptional repressor NF-X1